MATDTEIEQIETDFKHTKKCLTIWIATASACTAIFYFLIKSDNLNIQIIEIFPFLSCVMAGILGSSTAALISALQRYSDGIELGDGKKHPDPSSTKQTFNIRFANFLRLRPILGIYTSFLVYFGSSFFINQQIGSNENNKLVFLSLLCGFFAKTLLDKMKYYFERIIGKTS